MSEWRALSLRQPWLWIVVNLGKWVENRSKRIGLPPGPFILHASREMHIQTDYLFAQHFVRERFGEELASKIPPYESDQLVRGAYCAVTRTAGMLRANAFQTSDLPKVLGAHGSRLEPGDKLRVAVDDGTPEGWREVVYDLRWWMREQQGYLLDEVRPLEPTGGNGSLGFFRVPAASVAALGLPPSPEDYEILRHVKTS